MSLPGWKFWEWSRDSVCATHEDGTEVELGSDSVSIEWAETRDDHYGNTIRRASIPLTLIDELRGRLAAARKADP